jgi:hypothetical protein
LGHLSPPGLCTCAPCGAVRLYTPHPVEGEGTWGRPKPWWGVGQWGIGCCTGLASLVFFAGPITAGSRPLAAGSE